MEQNIDPPHLIARVCGEHQGVVTEDGDVGLLPPDPGDLKRNNSLTVAEY